MIKDQIIFENKMNFLQTKCMACSSKEHISTHCPLIHYIVDKTKIVKQNLKDPGQKSRVCFNRIGNKYYKFNALYSLQYVKDCSERLRVFSKYFIDNEHQILENDSSIPSPGIISLNMISEPKITNNIEQKIQKKLKINTNIEKILESQKIYQNFTNLPDNREEKSLLNKFLQPNDSLIIENEEFKGSCKINLPDTFQLMDSKANKKYQNDTTKTQDNRDPTIYSLSILDEQSKDKFEFENKEEPNALINGYDNDTAEKKNKKKFGMRDINKNMFKTVSLDNKEIRKKDLLLNNFNDGMKNIELLKRNQKKQKNLY